MVREVTDTVVRTAGGKLETVHVVSQMSRSRIAWLPGS